MLEVLFYFIFVNGADLLSGMSELLHFDKGEQNREQLGKNDIGDLTASL